MILHALVLAWLGLLARLPFAWLYTFSRFSAWLIHILGGYRKKVVLGNLQIAFPNKTEAELNAISRLFYRHFTDLIFETIKSLHLSKTEITERLKLINPEVFHNLQEKQKDIIVVWGHYTNFEWMAMALPLCVPQKCHAVYQPLQNRHFNKTVVRIREQFGLSLYPMKDTYPYMLSQTPGNNLYIFMADQSPAKDKIKFYAPFFKLETPVHLGVENLARKLDAAVVFIYSKAVNRGHYELTAKLLTDSPNSLEPTQITLTHLKWLEEEIQTEPAYWLWSHKRWKHAKV